MRYDVRRFRHCLGTGAVPAPWYFSYNRFVLSFDFAISWRKQMQFRSRTVMAAEDGLRRVGGKTRQDKIRSEKIR